MGSFVLRTPRRQCDDTNEFDPSPAGKQIRPPLSANQESSLRETAFRDGRSGRRTVRTGFFITPALIRIRTLGRFGSARLVELHRGKVLRQSLRADAGGAEFLAASFLSRLMDRLHDIDHVKGDLVVGAVSAARQQR